MYFLNDKHPQYEYVLYCCVSNATPYLKHQFDNMRDVYQCVASLERWHNRYHQIFYIDNDFYNNHYSSNMNGVYYKFLRRKVLDWEEFFEKVS